MTDEQIEQLAQRVAKLIINNLHEGLIATLDDELIEEDYDDIQEKKFTKTAQKGWLGIGDKYWITSLIPPS